MSVAGEVASVTGGSRGIGRAIVLELAASGAKVAFTYYTHREAAQTVCYEVQGQGGEIVDFQQDVADFAGVKAVLASVKESTSV